MEMCKYCIHEKVCKNKDNFEKPFDACEDFENSQNPEKFANIYSMFQPIFEWIQKHYPSGEMMFIVDNRSAKMVHEHRVVVFDKNLIGMNNKMPESECADNGTEN